MRERDAVFTCLGFLLAVLVTGCRCPTCPPPLAEERGVIPVTVEDADWD